MDGFTRLAGGGCPPIADLMLALAAEFRDVDADAVDARLDELALPLFGIAGGEQRVAAARLADILDTDPGFDADRTSVAALWIDTALEARAGHPLMLAALTAAPPLHPRARLRRPARPFRPLRTPRRQPPRRPRRPAPQPAAAERALERDLALFACGRVTGVDDAGELGGGGAVVAPPVAGADGLDELLDDRAVLAARLGAQALRRWRCPSSSPKSLSVPTSA